jgi:calcium/calmodulin-dependent protein kinase I
VAYEAVKRSDPSGKVAVKVTKRKNISADIENTIRSEIEIMRTLDHPNIVKYISHYEEDGYWFVVLELLEGGEVFDRIVKKSRYDEKEARDLIYILLGAVKYIHDRDIVHRYFPVYAFQLN